MPNQVLNKIDKYYTDKIESFGATPKGVDWNGVEGQKLRFSQILKVVNDTTNPFTIADLGCGYGALLAYIKESDLPFVNYKGYDLSKKMIDEAKKAHQGDEVEFHNSGEFKSDADYIVSSGIFSVKMDVDAETWKKFIVETIEKMNTHSKKGFAFNCLTKYSDEEYMRDDLYYADPMELFDYCKRNFSRNVALLHDYDLYEFTIVVRK